MAKAKTSRIVWALCALLALVLASGLGLLFLQLRPYWVAKYRGQGANLQGAFLAHAPLAGAVSLVRDAAGRQVIAFA